MDNNDSLAKNTFSKQCIGEVFMKETIQRAERKIRVQYFIMLFVFIHRKVWKGNNHFTVHHIFVNSLILFVSDKWFTVLRRTTINRLFYCIVDEKCFKHVLKRLASKSYQQKTNIFEEFSLSWNALTKKSDWINYSWWYKTLIQVSQG